MGNVYTRAGNFIGQGQLKKKGRTVGSGITCTGNRISGNGIMEADTTQGPDGRIKLLKGKIQCTGCCR